MIESAESAVALWKENSPPELIIVDGTIENSVALDLCRTIKTDPDLSLIPILAVEMKKNGLKRADFEAVQCDDILPFPVESDSFAFRVKSLLRLRRVTAGLDNAENVLYTLARTLEAKDPYTMGHMDRVAFFAVELGKALGVHGHDLETLRKGGLLHDVGKIAIPDAILLKPGKYTEEEFAVMKKHPLLGCQICEKLRSIKDTLPLIRHHHERLNGTGYPDRLGGDQIPQLVRIVTIVDIYDALRSRRVYKQAFSLDKSFQIMWEEVEKGWWDRHVLKTWEKSVRSNKIKAPLPPVA